MCSAPKTIQKRESKRRSKDADGVRIVTVCKHGIRLHWSCGKDLGRGDTYSPRSGQRHTHHFALWPPEVQEFARTLVEPKPSQSRSKLSIVQQRAKKVQRLLATWERKLKIAKTKVKQYRKKVAYYDKKLPLVQFDHGLQQVPELNLV